MRAGHGDPAKQNSVVRTGPCARPNLTHIMYHPDSKSHRLPGYDYSQPGWYFVTLSTRNMSCLFGSVRNGIVNLADAGRMIEQVWQELPRYSSRIDLDTFQVMPNHFHGILIIKEDLEQGPNNFSVCRTRESWETAACRIKLPGAGARTD